MNQNSEELRPEIIQKFNSKIKEIDITTEEEQDAGNLSPIFIVGAPRTGSTLLYQAIVTKYDVGYPSNCIARFWDNPVVGYILQKDIAGDIDFQSDFDSEHGYAKNKFLEPHEFGFFWDRWFDNSDSHYSSPDEEVSLKLNQEVSKLFAISGKKWVFKNLTLGLKIPLLKQVFPKAKFVWIKRNPLFVAQSLLIGRRERYDDINTWWSLKPKEINSIQKLNPEEQVIAQIFFSEKQIKKDLNQIRGGDFVKITYEKLCENPDEVLENKLDWFNSSKENKLNRNFKTRNKVKTKKKEINLLKKYIQEYF